MIGFTCHNESVLIGLFRQRQFADERKWLFVSADVRGAGTRDEPLRTSAWKASVVHEFRRSTCFEIDLNFPVNKASRLILT